VTVPFNTVEQDIQKLEGASAWMAKFFVLKKRAMRRWIPRKSIRSR